MNKIKIFAITAVALMLLSGITILQDSSVSDAAESDLTPMNPGSWTWNPNTGIGPFNSFYAAFEISDGNSFYSILDPYDLSKTISGEALPEGPFNIMWVVPTVYLKETATSLTFSDDDFDAVTYAHKIDEHVYNFLAIGVYEASTIEVNGQTYLASVSGATPSASLTRPEFRALAQNYSMSPSLDISESHPAHAMLWNFDQWQLYKMICYAVMEDANSQNTVGNGFVYASSPSTLKTTGLLDQKGPYSGNPGVITDTTTGTEYGSDSVKLFIENAWGGLREFIDGVVFVGQYTTYLDSSSTPTDSQTTGGTVQKVDWTIRAGYPTSIMTNIARTWGFPGSTVTGSSSTGLTDYVTVASSTATTVAVGGSVKANNTDSVKDGISNYFSNQPLNSSASDIGTRLAFVCDVLPSAGREYEYTMTYDASLMTSGSNVFNVADINPISHDYPSEPVTISIVAGEGGSVSTETVTGVPAGSIITTDGASMTINGTTVTATASDPTAQYTFAFDKWSGIPAGGLIAGDLTITASFSETLRSYTVTWIIGEVEAQETYQYGQTPSIADPTPPEGKEFKGWDPPITVVTGDAVYTAIFGDPSGGDPTHDLLNLVPFFIVIAVVMAAVGGIAMSGRDPMAIIKLVIGILIAVIILATLVLPVLGGI